MADKVIMLDTSILIDYYRKTDKTNSVWYKLVNDGYEFYISAITKYEILAGSSQIQSQFWTNIFEAMTTISFDENTVDKAVEINAILKKKNKQIALADLFIAATAISHHLPFATLNRKHFDRIDAIIIVD